MNTRKMIRCAVMFSAVVLALSATAGPAQAGESVEATGQEQFVQALSAGWVSVQGDHTTIKGMVDLQRIDSADPRMAGWATRVYDTVMDGTGAGYMHGSLRLVTDAGGVWEGEFSGVSNSEHYCGYTHAQGSLAFEHLELILTDEDGQATAYIVEAD